MGDESATANRPGPPAWPGLVHRSPEEVEVYDRMVGTLREFLDTLAGAKPDAATLAALTGDLAAWSQRLGGWAVDEHEQIFARLLDKPGRGQTLAPSFVLADEQPGQVRGHVTFGRYYLGMGGAVHGGALALLFDEVLGRAASRHGGRRTRTAYLNVTFKALTPLDTELEVTGWIDRVEDRKLFLRGELRRGDVVCAEAESLFVALKPKHG